MTPGTSVKHGWVTPLPNGLQARCMGPPGCPVCVAEWETLNAQEGRVCQCGRRMQWLNYISPRPTCVGCGNVEENCRCAFGLKVYPPKPMESVFSRVVGHD